MEPITPEPRRADPFGYWGIIFTLPDGREVFAHQDNYGKWHFCVPHRGTLIREGSGTMYAPAGVLHYARKHWVPYLLQTYGEHHEH